MVARRLLLISNSTLYGGGYLQHCENNIKSFLGSDVQKVLFIPYALHDRDDYTKTARDKFCELGYGLESVHESADPKAAVSCAQAIFIGGGNTFRLLKTLYDEGLVDIIRERVMEHGVRYMGSSAGSNVSTCSIHTTNDMPIVYPPSFTGLGLVPFNINPHYLHQQPGDTTRHMGESRETRINQYHEYPTSPPVLGLREGCLLLVEGSQATLHGTTGARLFTRGEAAREYTPGDDVSFLL